MCVDRRQCAEAESLGSFHDCDDDSDRAADGGVSAATAAGSCAGDIRDWICAGFARDLGRAMGIADASGCEILHAHGPGTRDCNHFIWIRRVGAAGLAAACASRLFEYVCKAGDHRTARSWHRLDASHAAHAAAHSVY